MPQRRCRPTPSSPLAAPTLSMIPTLMNYGRGPSGAVGGASTAAVGRSPKPPGVRSKPSRPRPRGVPMHWRGSRIGYTQIMSGDRRLPRSAGRSSTGPMPCRMRLLADSRTLRQAVRGQVLAGDGIHAFPTGKNPEIPIEVTTREPEGDSMNLLVDCEFDGREETSPPLSMPTLRETSKGPPG